VLSGGNGSASGDDARAMAKEKLANLQSGSDNGKCRFTGEKGKIEGGNRSLAAVPTFPSIPIFRFFREPKLRFADCHVQIILGATRQSFGCKRV